MHDSDERYYHIMSIEKHVMNVQDEGTGSNHEKMRQKAAEIFIGYDLDAMAAKLGLEYDKEYIYIEMFSRKYRVCKEDGFAEWSEDGFKTAVTAGFNESMTLYDLIAYSKEGAKPSGDYTKINNLADTVTGSYYAGKGMVDSMAKEFEGQAKELAKGCEAIGGTPYGRGDVSYLIPFWKNLCFVLSFWDADDEFPGQLNVYADSSMKDFLHYETIWYAEVHMMQMIKRAGGLK